jgi:hypothetical protein
MKSKTRYTVRQLLSWHRYAGLSVALLAIHLSITGILLNHTADFSLDKSYLASPALLAWYNIELPEQLDGFRLEKNWVTEWDGQIYFNDQLVSESAHPLRGAVVTPRFFALATSEQIWLLTIDGEVIEKISAPAEKLGDISSMGVHNRHVVIKTEQGLFRADDDLIAWQPVTQQGIELSRPQPVPGPLMENLFARGHSISWERLLLDIHSGRIATQAGTFLVDLAGVTLLFLAITGFTIWLKRRHRK